MTIHSYYNKIAQIFRQHRQDVMDNSEGDIKHSALCTNTLLANEIADFFDKEDNERVTRHKIYLHMKIKKSFNKKDFLKRCE